MDISMLKNDRYDGDPSWDPFVDELAPKRGTIDELHKEEYERRRECPLSMMTDSYKATHFLMYPPAKEMRAYGEFRKKFDGMPDSRLVVYGTRYYVDNFISQTIHWSDVTSSRAFLAEHFLSKRINGVKGSNGEFLPNQSPYFKSHVEKTNKKIEDAKKEAAANGSVTPKAIAAIKKGVAVEEMNYLDLLFQARKFPVKIEAMPEGSVIRPHVPLYIVTATKEYSRLCTFLETLLTMLWYPCCVATLSRHTKTLIENAYKETMDDPSVELDDPDNINTKLGYSLSLNSRLHDFGFRGCTSVEQSVIGGCAHLLNFTGSDTMSACYYAQYVLNGGNAIGKSIPATEHSVMTSWNSEVEAVRNLCKQFPGGFVSSVMDAYDYDRMLDEGLKYLKDVVMMYRCTLVVRPDSGKPVEQVLKALQKGEEAGFAVTRNKKGYKILNNYAVIQGDGINYTVVGEILDAVKNAKYAACNVAFGMGGGLLQKVNRDTMSFATKLCYMKDDNDIEIAVMKCPKGEAEKTSLGGKMVVLHEINGSGKMIGPHFVCTEDAANEYLKLGKHKKSMQVIYDGTDTSGASAADIKAFNSEMFDAIKKRVEEQWALPHDPTSDPIDISIRKSQEKLIEQIKDKVNAQYANLEHEKSQAAPVEQTGNNVSAQDAGLNVSNSPVKSSMDSPAHALLRMLDRLV